ncbi:MerR family transcriptional regulator [Nesterenkonia alkaliphila]|uniref:MerR family transcriptional regulator n=1 Tax=Nesterenkonia alkaliphila TaxID=1463631 RepID=A0A7K1UFL8_9MICC|nr:MerR family transcriptional regulator [Nesterenkonia alkaliphila]
MSIGELAHRTGVSPRSIRYYEQQGLLVSERTGSGHRRFLPEVVERVILIQHMFAAGLSSQDIYPILPCMIDESQRTRFLMDELRRHRDRLVDEVRKQQETINILNGVIEEYDHAE